MAQQVMSDADVFGDSAGKVMSDAEVFGQSKPSTPRIPRSKNPIVDYVGQHEQAKMDRLDQAAANREAAKGKPVLQPIKDATSPMKAVGQAWSDAYQKQAGGRPLPTSLGEVGQRYKVGIDDTVQFGRNVLSTITAPFASVSNQVVNPLARLGEKAGIMDEEFNTNALNTALAGAKPGKAPPPKPPSPLRETVQQFDRAQVRPSLAASQGKGSASVANVVAENPLAGGRTRANLRGAVDDASQSADRLAGQYGTVRGPQITGENVQAGVKDFSSGKNGQTFATKADRLYTDVFSQIDAAQAAKTGVQANKTALGGGMGARPYSPVTASQTEATLGILAKRAGGEIGSVISDPKLSTIAQAVMTDRGVTNFGDLRALRTWVRTAQRDPALRQGVDDAALQSLERALTADIMSNAESLAGPQVAAQLRRADQFYAAGSKRIQDALQPFADAQSGETAYRRVIQAAQSGGSADAQRVLSLKRSLKPDEWGDVAANTINELGKPTASNAGMGDEFSVAGFLTNYNKLSPRARDILFGSVGGGGGKASGLKSELDNLANVIGKLKSVEKGANVSKSAVSIQGQTTIGGGAAALGMAVMGNPAPLAGYVSALTGFAGVGELMTNPAFVRWLAGSAKAPKAVTLRRLDMLAATSPAISAYRSRLQQNVGQDEHRRIEPVGDNVPAPQATQLQAPALVP